MKYRHLLPLLALFSADVARCADFDIRDADEFLKLVPANARLKKLAGDMKFTEGPVWVPALTGGYLIFSDVQANRLMKWTPVGGLSVYRDPSGKANGNTLDLQANLLTAEHGNRRISVTEPTGKIWTVVDTFDGRKFNSPNDVVMRTDGTVWFTDPDYGLEGRTKEQNGNFVFCFNSATSQAHVVATDFDKPNGLCLSPDQRLMYIADSGKPRHIRAFVVTPEGNLMGSRVFCTIEPGAPDGIRCDEAGRVWSSAGDGVHIFATDGKLIGKILVPETPSNLSFGGDDLRTLFITARTSLYSIQLAAKGPPLPKPRRMPEMKPDPREKSPSQ